MKKITIILLLLTTGLLATSAQQVLTLSGMWDFATGDETVQKKGKTVSVVPRSHYDDVIELPGSAFTNDKGTSESGVVWYRKKVYVSKDWKGRRITLFLERPHIETTVYINGRKAGHQTSHSTPHRYDLSKLIKAGQQNEIAIRVCNSIENMGGRQELHSVTDQSQDNWNGITGRMELQAQWKHLNIRSVDIAPAHNLQSYRVEVKLENHIPLIRILPFYDYNVQLIVKEWKDGKPGAVLQKSYANLIGWANKVVFNMPGLRQLEPWDEFHPNIYHLTILAGEDVYETTFGLRCIDTEGRKVRTNGRPLFLRGTMENSCFPETGYPPTDKDSWLRIMRKCKTWGLNLMRFHNYCPPEAAFQAADEVGIYLQPEVPLWLGQGKDVDQYLKNELKRISDTYGHHPSLCLLPTSPKEGEDTLLASIEELPPGFTLQKEGARGELWDNKAAHLEAFRNLFVQGGMAPMADSFMDSLRMQTLYYKYQIERNMCTSDYVGFLLPSLNDCSRQGTAIVGPLDAHWKEKGYVTARKWKEFCNAQVVLARFPRFVFTTADTLRVPIEMINAIYGNLLPCATTWQVFQNDSIMYQTGMFPSKAIPIGKGTQLGTVVLPLDSVKAPAKMTLCAIVGNTVLNHWDFWVYDSPPS